MAEKDKIYKSKIKNTGLFKWSDFYKFCYDWLVEEGGYDVMESKYIEKVSGDSKNVDVEWKATDKVTDYFKFEVKITFKIIGMTEVEVQQGSTKTKMNKGSVELVAAGTLVRDYDGKFEKNAWQKFLRSIYEKWIIPSRIDQYEGKLVGDLDEFLEEAKAFLALEGRR